MLKLTRLLCLTRKCKRPNEYLPVFTLSLLYNILYLLRACEWPCINSHRFSKRKIEMYSTSGKREDQNVIILWPMCHKQEKCLHWKIIYWLGSLSFSIYFNCVNWTLSNFNNWQKCYTCCCKFSWEMCRQEKTTP